MNYPMTNPMEARYDPPPGYRFRPDVEQLLVHYLRPKLEGEAYPETLVPFCNLYGDQEPWQIWDTYQRRFNEDQPDLFFITQNKKKSEKGKRICRTIGSGGTWKGEDSGKKVLSAASGKVIGTRKRFHYNNQDSHENGRWIMHQYELDASLLRNKNQAKNFVLCLIRKNIKTKKKNHEEEEDDEMVDVQKDQVPDGAVKEESNANTTQEQDEFTKHVMNIDFEAYLLKQIAEQQTTENKQQYRSIEELESELMSDDYLCTVRLI